MERVNQDFETIRNSPIPLLIEFPVFISQISGDVLVNERRKIYGITIHNNSTQRYVKITKMK